MVKGVSRQVIVLRPTGERLFEQAIFILKDNAPDVTDAMLLREAVELSCGKKSPWSRLLWAGVGGACVGLIWLITVIY